MSIFFGWLKMFSLVYYSEIYLVFLVIEFYVKYGVGKNYM